MRPEKLWLMTEINFGGIFMDEIGSGRINRTNRSEAQFSFAKYWLSSVIKMNFSFPDKFFEETATISLYDTFNWKIKQVNKYEDE